METLAYTKFGNRLYKKFTMAIYSCFMQSADLTALNILQTVYQGASAFGNTQLLADDVTMVALKISGYFYLLTATQFLPLCLAMYIA